MSEAPDEAYVDGVLAAYANNWLDKLNSNTEPFF